MARNPSLRSDCECDSVEWLNGYQRISGSLTGSADFSLKMTYAWNNMQYARCIFRQAICHSENKNVLYLKLSEKKVKAAVQ